MLQLSSHNLMCKFMHKANIYIRLKTTFLKFVKLHCMMMIQIDENTIVSCGCHYFICFLSQSIVKNDLAKENQKPNFPVKQQEQSNFTEQELNKLRFLKALFLSLYFIDISYYKVSKNYQNAAQIILKNYQNSFFYRQWLSDQKIKRSLELLKESSSDNFFQSKDVIILTQKLSESDSKNSQIMHRFFFKANFCPAGIKIKFKVMLIHKHFELNQKEQQTLISFLRVKDLYNQIMLFLKLSDLLKIATQVPQLVFHNYKSDIGYYLQDKVFPDLRSRKKVYAKDYQLLQKLDSDNAKKIGSIPSQQKEEANYIDLYKEKQFSQDRLELDDLDCGIDVYGYDNYQMKQREPLIVPSMFESQKQYNECLEIFRKLSPEQKKQFV